MLTAAGNGVTAFCFEDDSLAMPVLFRLRQYGKRVPEQISLIGFDDNDLAATVGLTTVHQDPHDMGMLAARKVLGLIAGDPLGKPFEVPRSPLVLRETTAPVVA